MCDVPVDLDSSFYLWFIETMRMDEFALWDNTRILGGDHFVEGH